VTVSLIRSNATQHPSLLNVFDYSSSTRKIYGDADFERASIQVVTGT
jgi:hypothetical protein